MRLLSIVAALWFVGGMSAAAAQTITEYRIPNAIEQPHSIVAGPDGNMWFVGNREVGRVTIEGTFTEFKLPVSGPEDFPTTGFAHGIAAGPDGNLWFTADNVVRITPQGAMTEFRLGTDARPRGIVTGTDGNIWFAENGANKIGRITPQGGITEFPIASDLGRPYGITAAPDGNIWFTTEGTFENVVGRITPLGTITTYKIPTPSPAAHGIAADAAGNLWFTEYQQNKIGRMTPDGVFSEFDVASPSSSARPENIILGPDGAMWFTVFVSNTIGRITSDGTISEYNVPTAGSGPEGIAVGPDGNIWFTEGASGNRIGKLLLSPDGMHLGPVFSSTQPGGRSYIRIHNRGTSNGTATITLSDPTTGVALTSWVSPAIPANAELEFDVATIENAASSNFVKPGYYETSVTASMSGYVRHIFSRFSDQSITNLTACSSGLTTPKKELAGVHTSRYSGSQLSGIVVHNTGIASKPVGLGIYDARTGAKRGTYTTTTISSGGSVTISAGDLDLALGRPDAVVTRYVVKAETAFAGYLQHLMTDPASGFVGDMSFACDLSPASNTRTDMVTYQTPTILSRPTSIAAGADGSVWFTEANNGAIGRITSEGLVSEFRFSSAAFRAVDITAGPDGKMWFTGGTPHSTGKINTTGTIELSSIATPAGSSRSIAVDSGGKLWFTDTSANAVRQVQADGTLKTYTLPTASALPLSIVAAPDGYLWFTQFANRIGRISTSGTLTEFSAISASGIGVGADGSLWATGASDIVKLTPGGLATRYSLPTQQSNARGITKGADGNMWFVENASNQIGKITPSGTITEFKLPENSSPEDIVSGADGDLWVTNSGTFSIARFTPSLSGVHVTGVFSTKQASSLSFLKVYNPGATSGVVAAVVTDAQTGQELGTWTSPAISAGTEVQFAIADIEAGARISAPASARYGLSLTASFTGYFQHIVWRPSDGTFANLTTCDTGATLDRTQLFAVHSSLFQNNYPSFVSISNVGGSGAPVKLGIYSGATGAKLGTFNGGTIPAHGQLFLPVSAIEAATGISPTVLRYIIKSEGPMVSALQHFVNNVQAKFSIDMTAACTLQP